MDDPDITMEEYIQLEVKKAIDMVRRLTRKLLRMDNNDDEIDVESCLEIMSTKPFDGVIDANVDRGRLNRIYDRRVHRVLVLDFKELTEEMGQAMTDRLRMEHSYLESIRILTCV
nr:hypothetical protein [Tanacetum cinerariifolium]